jgi:hypothetical protein
VTFGKRLAFSVNSGHGNSRLFTHGRGIYPMRTLTGKVCFEQSGSAMRMRKNCDGALLLKGKSQ